MSDSLYIYAFCDAPTDPADTGGLAGKPLRFVSAGGVYAAVSEAPKGRLRPQRKLLAAHQSVVASIAAQASTLPCAFGLVADSEEQLVSTLDANAPVIQGELARVAGCVEFDLRLAWDVPNVFEHLVSIDDDLHSLRDRIAIAGDAAPHDLKVAVGRRVERVIASIRDHAWHELEESISIACRELSHRDPSGEEELARAAVLVPKMDVPAFEASVDDLATRFDEHHAIRLSGPFAPHSFVDLKLELNAAA